MNNIQIFESPEFGEIRTMMIDDEPWFVGKDIAEVLGYGNTRDALANHVDEEDKTMIQKSEIPTLEIPNRGLIIINESGLYSLIMSSKLPTAKRFKRWVTSEVLPSIRKNGGYIAGQETMSDEELMAKALLVAQNKIAERDAIIQRQQMRIEADRPKAVFADAVSASRNSILIRDLAKMICQNGYKIGQNRLFDWMRDNGYLIKHGSSRNLPKQKYIEQGLFEIKETTIVDGSGFNKTKTTTKVTGKGQIYFVNKFLGKKE